MLDLKSEYFQINNNRQKCLKNRLNCLPKKYVKDFVFNDSSPNVKEQVQDKYQTHCCALEYFKRNTFRNIH